jgi:hypothetical protein
MTMELAQRVTCNYQNCPSKGPWGDTAPHARKLAAKDGWQVGVRMTTAGGRGNDFCPDHKEEAHMQCEYGDCTLTALYKFTRQGEEYPACGKHYPILLRDMFNASSEPMMVTSLRSPKDHRTGSDH